MDRLQEDHADLGLIADDNTEDMRRRRCTLCVGAGWRPGRMAVIACTHNADMRTAPVDLDAPTSSGSRSSQINPREPKGITMMTYDSDAEWAAIDARFAHVQPPAGASLDATTGWAHSPTESTYSRALTWCEDIETGVEGVCLDISGLQQSDGSFTRSVRMYTDGADLSADDARRLAAALTEAAAELEKLERQR